MSGLENKTVFLRRLTKTVSPQRNKCTTCNDAMDKILRAMDRGEMIVVVLNPLTNCSGRIEGWHIGKLNATKEDVENIIKKEK